MNLSAWHRLRLRFQGSRLTSAAIGWAAGLVLAWFFVFPLRSSWPNDYYGFWAAGQFSRSANLKTLYGFHGQVAIPKFAQATAENAGSNLEWRMRFFYHRLDLTATPFHYAVISLISGGGLERDYHRFVHASSFIYVIAIMAFATYLRFPFWSLPALVLFFTRCYWPFQRDIMDGNDSALIAGLAALSLLLLQSRRDGPRLAAGFALGLLSLFKPTVIFAPFFAFIVLIATDRRGAACFAAGLLLAGVVAVVSAAAIFGPVARWSAWLKYAPKRSFEIRGMAGGLLGRYFHVRSTTPYHAVALVMLSSVAAFLWRECRQSTHHLVQVSRHAPHGFDAVAAGAAGLAAYLLAGVLVWGHYFTIAMPAALIALRPRPHLGRRGWIPFSLGAEACVFLAFQGWFRAHNWTTWGNYSPITLVGTVIVLGVCLWDVRDSGRLGESAA